MITSLPFWWHFDIYRWQDALEIFLFTASLYYFSLWLYQDKHKRLLLALYGYCTLIITTQALHLTTLNTLLITLLPMAIAFFVLMHHETLQKKFIALHRITPLEQPTSNLIEDLVRAGLTAANNNCAFTCVLEKKEALTTLLTAPSYLHSPCTSQLLNLISTSSLYNPYEIIWINANAKIEAYNASWIKNSVDRWLTQEVQEQEQWLKDALFFTTKTDALFIKLIPSTRTFTLIAGGKIIEKVLAAQACSAIKKYLGYPAHTLQGDWHVISRQNSQATRIRS